MMHYAVGLLIALGLAVVVIAIGFATFEITRLIVRAAHHVLIHALKIESPSLAVIGRPRFPRTPVGTGRLVWIDLETCGLERDSPILEIAIVVTDNDLNVVATFERVVFHPQSRLNAWLSDHTRAMHIENGLLDDVRRKGLHPIGVEWAAIEFLDRHAPPVEVANADGTTRKDKPVLCGSSVHSDRRWLECSMPRLARCFAHRHLDASGLKIAAGLLGATDFGPRDATAPHRAMPDIRESIRLAKYARDYGAGPRAVWLHAKAIGRVLRRMIAR